MFRMGTNNMADSVKEKLIMVTIELITGGGGNIEDITTRAIAQKAGVGVGLVNYHFQTKDNLIEICVGRIIRNVISVFLLQSSSQIKKEHI